MEGLLTGRADSLVVGNAIAAHKGNEIGFEDAVALVKQHQGAILIRTKSGSCMVRLANGSVLGVTPPAGTSADSPEGREKCVTKLLHEIERLNKVILINKNTLDKAHHHLRDKDLEIKQLKTKLEEKDRENHIQNKIISVRGKRIQELISEIKVLETKLAKTAEEELNRRRKTDRGENPKVIPDYGHNKITATTVGMEHVSKPCSGI